MCVRRNVLNCRGHKEDIDLIERKQLPSNSQAAAAVVVVVVVAFQFLSSDIISFYAHNCLHLYILYGISHIFALFFLFSFFAQHKK